MHHPSHIFLDGTRHLHLRGGLGWDPPVGAQEEDAGALWLRDVGVDEFNPRDVATGRNVFDSGVMHL